MQKNKKKHTHSFNVIVGVSQKGSRELCLPAFFSENETEENGKKEGNGKNGKIRNPRKTAKKGKKKRKRKTTERTEKTEENGKNWKRHRSGDPFCEIPALSRDYPETVPGLSRHFPEIS